MWGSWVCLWLMFCCWWTCYFRCPGGTLMSLAELKPGSVHCLLFAHLSFFLNYILVWAIEHSFVKEHTVVLPVCHSLLLGLSCAHTFQGLSQEPVGMVDQSAQTRRGFVSSNTLQSISFSTLKLHMTSKAVKNPCKIVATICIWMYFAFVRP